MDKHKQTAVVLDLVAFRARRTAERVAQRLVALHGGRYDPCDDLSDFFGLPADYAQHVWPDGEND